jgi:pyruvate-formate lyase-activating enzyme
LLKWSWSTVFFNSGTTASCHRTQKYAIDPDNFANFHNLPDKVIARKKMQTGLWPGHGCEYCKNTEAAGGVSDRLSNADADWLVPPELVTDATATDVTPTTLEVYFKNTCNMACVYCGPHFSSLWEEENRKFGKSFGRGDRFDVKTAQYNPDYDRMVADFWQYLGNKYKTIRRYHILGGEPFLMQELDDSIEFWRTHPNPDLTFSIITNLNIPTERFERYIKKFEKLVLGNKIWRLQLTASLDCWGDEQEYVRYGLNVETWQRNFELMLNKPWIVLSINSAVSALTIKSMPQLLTKINEWNLGQTAVIQGLDRERRAEPILHSFNTTGQLDDPYKFGSYFEQDMQRILALMPTATEDQQRQYNIMAGMAQQLSAGIANPVKIKELTEYLDQLDLRRQTNWRNLFPWLNNDFSV